MATASDGRELNINYNYSINGSTPEPHKNPGTPHDGQFLNGHKGDKTMAYMQPLVPDATPKVVESK